MLVEETSRKAGVVTSAANKVLIEAVGGAILLCAIGFIAQWSYGFGWADEGLLWYASQRTFLGEIPILDFYSYDPGRYYWSSLFFSITGSAGLFELLIAGCAFGAIGLASVWYAMIKAGISWKVRLGCATLLVVALGFPRHKVYEQSLTLILYASVFFTLVNMGKAKQWLIFGLATGLAAFIGRNHGVYFVASFLLIALYMQCANKRPILPIAILWFSVGTFVGYSPMLIMMLFQPGFLKAFVDSLLAISTWQLPLPIPFIWRANLSGGLTTDLIQTASVGVACILIPLIYAAGIFFFIYESRRGNPTNRIATLAGAGGIAGIPYMHQAFDRADFSHIAQAVLPVIPTVLAIAYYLFAQNRKIISVLLALIGCLIILACWLPIEPAVKYLRQTREELVSISVVDIDGKKFALDNQQAEIISAVRSAVKECNIGKDEILAAPHFPGIYALLNAKAPFWEMYYLYKRPDDFQRSHIKAISNTKLVLLSPEATVDGLESLKLKNTYTLLVDYIDKNFSPLVVMGSPGGIRILIRDGACQK